MNKSTSYTILFFWLLFLSTFLLNTHLLLEPFIGWFTYFYYASYFLLPILILTTRASFFYKGLLGFGIALWMFMLLMLLIALQNVLSSVYGEMYQGSEIITVFMTVSFMTWSAGVGFIFMILGLIIKIRILRMRKSFRHNT